jgi:lipoprotein-anchoring transpeptidase ErfK/SrfK
VKRGELHLRARIGGLIEIHGEGGQGRDWTNGCVALSNRDMDEVFALARVGTRVTIVGTS